MSLPFVKGDYILVHKGRKHPHGLVGKVFWTGDTQYGVRLGFKVLKQQIGYPLGETVWIAANNCVHLTPTQLRDMGLDSATLDTLEMAAERRSKEEWLRKKIYEAMEAGEPFDGLVKWAQSDMSLTDSETEKLVDRILHE